MSKVLAAVLIATCPDEPSNSVIQASILMIYLSMTNKRKFTVFPVNLVQHSVTEKYNENMSPPWGSSNKPKYGQQCLSIDIWRYLTPDPSNHVISGLI